MKGKNIPELKIITGKNLHTIPQFSRLTSEQRFGIEVIEKVLPFRVNQYVLDSLIDWDCVPEDPIFQLVFPQMGMLSDNDFNRMADMIRRQATSSEIRALANCIRKGLNPHPADQRTANIPMMGEAPLPGMQHKYKETVLFFPTQGQTCHTYCSFCFRWAQFIGDKDLKFATKEREVLLKYLDIHPEVSNVIFTGGDPMVMKTRHLQHYLEPFLNQDYEHIQSIRIGTKALTYWPYRFLTDEDADELIALFEKLVRSGKHVTIMAHYNHRKEINSITEQAIKRLQATGVVIRSQGPLLKHVNDCSDAWIDMWNKQEQLGIIPYYMFVERDTGANRYFEIPLAKAYHIYRNAINSVSGLSRTARGPSMSTTHGKIEVTGIATLNGETVFVLRFIQARDPSWVQRPFFAKFSSTAEWFSKLEPAFGKTRFFFEEEYFFRTNVRQYEPSLVE